MVIVLASLDITLVDIKTVFLAFLRLTAYVSPLIRFQAVASDSAVCVPLPLPSKLMARLFMSGVSGLSEAPMPCTSAIQCGPPARNIRVRLLGAGPGVKLDFPKLSSNVPTRDSPCAATADAATTKHRTT